MTAFLTASLGLALLVFTFMVVSADQRNITAEPGDNVTLPCRATENKYVRIVEWSRTDLASDEHVLLYRNSQFDPDFQSPFFKDRVDLLDVENGDVSLVLKNVTTTDRGTYECRVVQRGNNRRKRSIQDTERNSTVNLRVIPDQINITAEPGDNVNLTCRAAEYKPDIVVLWSRTDLELDQHVILYKSNKFDPEGQSPSFKNRVDLLDVKNGDVSLVLKNVTTDDKGTYECRVDYARHDRSKRAILETDPICIIDLRVGSGITKKLKERGIKDPTKEDGGSCTGWKVGFSVVAIAAILIAATGAVVVFLLCKRQRNSSPMPDSPPAPEAEPLQDITGL